MSFSGARQRRTMNGDLEYYRLQPYARTFEIRTEGSERYLLYRIKEIPTIAGDGGDLLDPIQKISLAALGADLKGARVRLEAVVLKVPVHGPPLPRAGEAHLSWPPHRRPHSPAKTCGGAPDRVARGGQGDGSVHGCRRRGRRNRSLRTTCEAATRPSP